jgi:hypothetical protein
MPISYYNTSMSNPEKQLRVTKSKIMQFIVTETFKEFQLEITDEQNFLFRFHKAPEVIEEKLKLKAKKKKRK